MHIEIIDNSGKVKAEMQTAVLRSLEKCGLTAEGYAKRLRPVDTGNLRNSITQSNGAATRKCGEQAADMFS